LHYILVYILEYLLPIVNKDIIHSCTLTHIGAGSALSAAWLLGPRVGRYDKSEDKKILYKPIGNGTNSLIGLFMLWSVEDLCLL
jgi:hypothetical protein